MKITPMEITGKKFEKRFRGYDVAAVREFLEMVASDVEELKRECRYFEEELSRKNAEVNEFKSREQSLKDTLILAQKLARDMKNNMAKEAQVVLAEAEMEAEKILRQSHERAIELEGEIRELRNQRLKMTEEMRAILSTHQKLLDMAGEGVAASEAEEDKVARISVRAKRDE